MKDVEVQISLAAVAGSTGPGIPLIIAGKAASNIPYTEVTNLTEVNDAGFADSTDVYKQCNAIFLQNDRPATIAVMATTKTVKDGLADVLQQDFRQIIACFGESDSSLSDLATYVETLDNKMLFIKVTDTEELRTLSSYDRVFPIYYEGASGCTEGAVVGATAGYDAGSFTYHDIIVKGITPDNISDTKVREVAGLNGNCIIQKAGDTVIHGGMVGSGEFADVIDSMDYIIKQVEYKAQKYMNAVKKVPFDNAGIGALELIVLDVLKECYNNGMIATDDDGTPLYSTNFATRAETPQAERGTRTYTGGKFEFEISGAIHYARITGVLNI